MKKQVQKLSAIALSLLLIFSFIPFVPFSAFAESAGALTYKAENGNVTVTGLVDKDYSGELIVPSSIGGFPVTSIGQFAFYQYSGIKNVTLPDSVKTVGDYAFYQCSALESITLPSLLTSIGNGAFHSCEKLKSITLLDSLKSIGEFAFYNCSSLKGVTLPASLTSVGKGAFFACAQIKSINIPALVTYIGEYAFPSDSGLESISVNTDNKVYSSAGNCLIKTAQKLLVAGCKNSVIPSDGSVTEIGSSAFFHCAALNSVTIPDKVTKIGNSAFYGCAGIESLIIPASVTSIGASAFSFSLGLNVITISASVTSIGQSAFSGCIKLNEVYYAGTEKQKAKININSEGGGNDPLLNAAWYNNCEKIYSITYKTDGGENNAENPKTYSVKGSTVTLADPLKKGYTFKGWYADSAFKTKVTEITKGTAGDKTLYAKWSKNTYKITYKLNKGINSNKNPKKYTVTSPDITLVNPTRRGYEFGGWYSDEKLTKRVKTVKEGSTGDKTLYAKWSVQKYKITYKLNKGKNNAKNPKKYTVASADITLKNPTRKGYTFKGWYSDSKFKKKVTKIKTGAVGDKTLYAKWSKNTYKITYKLNKGKNNAKNPKKYTVTTSDITLKSPTRRGYTFKGWYSDSKFKKKVTKITKGTTGNKTLYAKWTKKK